MRLAFSKYSGCGNDFILVDSRHQLFSLPSNFLTKLCHRQYGIGADGVIFLEPSVTADFRMRIFNADGSEAEMCGNGIRCLGRFIRELGLPGDHFSIETMRAVMHISLLEELVSVSMPFPTDINYFTTLSIQEKPLTLHYLDTGVPHAVIFVDDIAEDAHFAQAPAIRFHPHFSPRGTNVNFAQISSKQIIDVRTYERGVEQETLACGTGAVAVAVVAVEVLGLQSPITIRTRSTEFLKIELHSKLSCSAKLTMTGPATKVFHGEIDCH